MVVLGGQHYYPLVYFARSFLFLFSSRLISFAFESSSITTLRAGGFGGGGGAGIGCRIKFSVRFQVELLDIWCRSAVEEMLHPSQLIGI